MRSPAPWEVLGLEREAGRDEVRRAYAARLKATHPEDDPEGFQQLRHAYEQMLAWLQRAQPHAEASQIQLKPGPKPRQRPAPRPQELAAEPEDPGRQAFAAEFAAIQEKHQEARARLERLVRSPEASPAERVAALEEVLTSPAMDSLRIWDATQHWLAALIAQNIPRSDPLVHPSIERFGWTAGNARYLYDRPQTFADPVLARRDDLYYAMLWARSGKAQSEVWKWLTRKPDRLDQLKNRLFPRRADRVWRFLAELKRSHPGLLPNLDPDAHAWWEVYFNEPQIPARLYWIAALATPITGWIVVALEGFRPITWPIYFFGCLQSLLGEAGCAYILVHVVLRWNARRKQKPA